MQNVRIILKNDQNKREGTVYEALTVSIDFEMQVVRVWNGAYWEETPFDQIKVLATWEE